MAVLTASHNRPAASAGYSTSASTSDKTLPWTCGMDAAEGIYYSPDSSIYPSIHPSIHPPIHFLLVLSYSLSLVLSLSLSLPHSLSLSLSLFHPVASSNLLFLGLNRTAIKCLLFFPSVFTCHPPILVPRPSCPPHTRGRVLRALRQMGHHKLAPLPLCMSPSTNLIVPSPS